MNNGYNTKAVISAWKAIGLPVAVPEHPFEPGRRWRFDFAWPALMVAVEVQGAVHGTGRRCPKCGQRKAGRHTRGAALKKEWEKLNTAAARGWRVLYCEPREVTATAFTDQLEEALFRQN